MFILRHWNLLYTIDLNELKLTYIYFYSTVPSKRLKRIKHKLYKNEYTVLTFILRKLLFKISQPGAFLKSFFKWKCLEEGKRQEQNSWVVTKSNENQLIWTGFSCLSEPVVAACSTLLYCFCFVYNRFWRYQCLLGLKFNQNINKTVVLNGILYF